MTAPRFPLFSRLPSFAELSNELILGRFLDYVAEKKITLYPAQEEAILALFEGQNVILKTPTGSGKSLVATALHFHSLAMGRRSVYTCPIKALVNEKFLALCRDFGPEQVGMATGDGSVNRDAPILVCTAEILANLALREGEAARVDDVVMDEFHYYADRDRGSAWQIPLLTLPRTRFLLMSATLGEMGFFARSLTELNGAETALVATSDRPVPLKYEYRETPLHETVKDLIDQGAAPVYLVCFSQREAAEEAQNLMSVDFTPKELKRSISESLHGVDFFSPYGKDVQKFLKHGLGLHHAGLLPKYRVLVEKLAQTGMLKVIAGTDTLGVGVNIPIRTVLFSKLCKYDGQKTAVLSVRDFHQIAGRAGRKGFDDSGRVVAQAPDHVIENLKLELKARSDPKKAKKIVKLKPPEKGYAHWGPETFQRLVGGQPEALQSRFQVSHAMLLNVLSRKTEDGCRVLRQIIRDSHEPETEKKKHRARAFTLFRSLLERKIVEIIPSTGRGTGSGAGKKIQVHVDLQDDFSLNHALSLYLIDTISVIDPASESYAIDVLTLVESILENPELILRKQLDRVKGEKVRELKEAGVEYEERMEELQKLEHPKPLKDFIYTTFGIFAEKHPWVGTESIRPKSIAREMYENLASFPEYIRDYELQRAEGLLLRYLSDVYRALEQTVPKAAKNDEIDAITAYFGSIVRSVDSSLIDEWEKIKTGELATRAKALQPAHENQDPLGRPKALRIRVANEVFMLVRSLAIGDFENAVKIVAGWAGDSVLLKAEGETEETKLWTEGEFESISRAYRDSEHKGLRIDGPARASEHSRVKMGPEIWQIEQTLVDPEGHNDWEIRVTLDLNASRAAAPHLVMRLVSIGPIA